jgi:hypothetical protein
VTPPTEFALLLDAAVPLDRPRAAYRSWDGRQWGRTLRAADWHRVSPLLFCHLESAGEAPAAVMSALERGYLANAARNLFILAAIHRVVDALHAEGIPAMLLKGAALIESAYPDPAQREMLDIDILVPSDRLGAAGAALNGLGYRPEDPAEGETGPTSFEVPADGHHGTPLVGRDRLVAVELHRHIAIAGEGRAFDIAQFWDRARPASGGRYLLPSAEDLLLHLCLHFTRNRLGGRYVRRNTGGALGQVCDIARVIAHESVQWPALARAARAYRIDARVFLALFAARELGVPVPDSALADLRPAGFDARVGRRLVTLRVLRVDDHLRVRSLRWMFAPSREVLARGWNADPTATLSLARAYMRRARAQVPFARNALRRPWLFVQDQRLNDQIRALEERI